MTTETDTDLLDGIDTETKTRTETEVVTHEHDYEVTTCHECGGETPVSEAVAVGLGLSEKTTTVHYKIRGGGRATIYHDITINDTSVDTTGETAPDFRASLGDSTAVFTHSKSEYMDDAANQFISITSTEPRTTLPYCAFCYNAIFDRDLDTALDAPAFDVHGPTDDPDDTDDESGPDPGQQTTILLRPFIALADRLQRTLTAIAESLTKSGDRVLWLGMTFAATGFLYLNRVGSRENGLTPPEAIGTIWALLGVLVMLCAPKYD